MSGQVFSVQCLEIRERIVLWKIAGRPTPAEWQRAMADATLWMSDLESRGQKSGVVVDPTEMISVDAEQRRAFGQWRAEHMPLIANTCICGSYVAPSSILRGAVTAVFWFAKPVVPVSVKATQQESIQWVELEMQRLLARGVP